MDQHIEVRREDGGVVSSQDDERLRAKMQGWTSDLSIGGQISVSCNIGPVWRVAIQGKKHFEISLMRRTRQFPDIAWQATSFHEQFLLDGSLVHLYWVKVVGWGAVEWHHRQNTFKLASRGGLVWTSVYHNKGLIVNWVFRTKKVESTSTQSPTF